MTVAGLRQEGMACNPSLWQGSQSPQPHLEDGTTYDPLRPTRLDKIENFQLEIQTGAVGGGDVKSNDAELASQGRRLAGAVFQVVRL